VNREDAKSAKETTKEKSEIPFASFTPLRFKNEALVTLLIATLGLTAPGCKSAAPPPPREEVIEEALPETTEIPEEFRAAEDVDTGEVDDGWIKTFNDPELEKLVDETLRNNLNLRIAATQIDVAAAAAVQAGARLKPTVDLALGASGSGTSSAGSGEGVVGLSTTWEIDVWGKLASGAAAAEASLAATQANYEYGRQSLAAQTAKSWFLASQTHMLLELALETADLYEQTLDLVKTKHEVGQVTMQDVHLASADLASSEEALRQAIAGDQQARRSLELLLGRYPGAEIEARSELPPLPPPVPVGLPSGLLERRPDLIAAEDNVAAAFYLTEQAEAAKLPSFALTGTVGASSDVNDFIFDLGAGMVAPLFRGGALEAQVDAADAQQRAAVAAYGQAVLKAFEEVEGALTNGKLYDEREEYLQQVLSENTAAWELAKTQYEVGKIDLLSVLQMQARVVGARIALVGIRNDRLINRVNLHLALGGSFEETEGKRVVAVAEE
jgi:NodT family efflux transporter outer membrane factor (OMF) lipoprotein